MDEKQLFDLWQSESKKPFSGWDFSYITKTDRMTNEPLLWSYASMILPHIKKAESLLDMGTGGGEYLSRLTPLPIKTYATEGFKPNIFEAKLTLESGGIKIVEADGEDDLPFDKNSFDLIINRHENFRPSEVYRILKPNGYFITQQVGGKDHVELNHLLGAEGDFGFADWSLQKALTDVRRAGFTIERTEEAYPYTRFYDVGAIVYYLKAIPWQVKDFSVEKYFDKLLVIHQKIQDQGFIDVHAHRFMVKVRK